MFDTLLKSRCPVGIEINRTALSFAQLQTLGKQVRLIAARRFDKPDNIRWESEEWIKWAVNNLQKGIRKKWFNNIEMVGSVLPSELYIENLNLEGEDKSDENIASIVEEKLPCSANELLIKTAEGEKGNFVVMAVRRELIEKYLEIYKQLGLDLKAIGVWPIALVNTYVHFFGRRETDKQAVVVLVNFDSDATTVAICRHKKLLFAKSLEINKEEVKSGSEGCERLVMELNATKKHFNSLYKDTAIDRAVFFPTADMPEQIYGDIARKTDMTAQIGDCLKAVELVRNPNKQLIERRNGHSNWAVVFGLSLYGGNNA